MAVMRPSGKIGIVGYSHITALSEAMAKDGATQRLLVDRPVEFVSLRRPGSLSGRLRHALSAFGPRDIVILAIAGNAHNVLGLVNFKPRFDFVLPSEPDLPLDAEADLLPLGLVKLEMARRTGRHIDMIRRVRRVCAAPMFHIESPPPVPSAEHLARHPGIFKDKIAELGVAPALLRYKLWRLYSEVVRAGCESIRIRFVPVPPETQDEAGMMREPYWNPNPTHGNRHYGACVMQQIRAIHERTNCHAPAEPEAASV